MVPVFKASETLHYVTPFPALSTRCRLLLLVEQGQRISKLLVLTKRLSSDLVQDPGRLVLSQTTSPLGPLPIRFRMLLVVVDPMIQNLNQLCPVRKGCLRVLLSLLPMPVAAMVMLLVMVVVVLMVRVVMVVAVMVIVVVAHFGIVLLTIDPAKTVC